MEALQETVASCEKLDGVKGGVVVPVQVDVTKKEDLERAFEVVKGMVGWLDVLVVNSGVSISVFLFFSFPLLLLLSFGNWRLFQGSDVWSR